MGHRPIGEITDLVDFDLAAVIEIKEVGALGGRVFADWLIEIEHARGIDGPPPATDRRQEVEVATESLLVNDDGRRDVFEHIGIRLAVVGHEYWLHEGGIGLVDEALAFGRDGAEDQGGLARTRHTGKHCDAALGNIERDVPEIVLARAADDYGTVIGEGHRLGLLPALGDFDFDFDFGLAFGFGVRLSATAARMRSFKAASLILSPSWKSIARLTLPSRLELNRPDASSNGRPQGLPCA